MNVCTARRKLFLLTLVVWCVPHGCVDADERAPASISPSVAVDAPAPGTASVVGKVVYRADPARPWRLGRYYIKRAKRGELAEAVVALSGRSLKGTDTPHEPQTVTIDQRDYQFTPETVVIRAGDRVKFTNSDVQIHNVQTSHPRHSFNVNMPQGSEHLETFAVAGGTSQPYRLGCVYHGAMRAWVFVFDHPWFRLTAADGAFSLSGIPPGQYRLEVVHPAGELRASRPITLRADETISVEFELTPDDRVDAKR